MSENNEMIVASEAKPLLFEEKSPKQIVAKATEYAEVLSDIIEKQKLYTVYRGGKKHVWVEGWTTLANFFHLRPLITGLRKRDENSIVIYDAVCEVHTIDDRVLSRAEASCSSAEVLRRGNGSIFYRWLDVKGNPDESSIKSMAQTRAIGKACRISLGWIMSLAGYETTPAEELSDVSNEAITIDATVETTKTDLKKADDTKTEEYFNYSVDELLSILKTDIEAKGDELSKTALMDELKTLSRNKKISKEVFTECMRKLSKKE